MADITPSLALPLIAGGQAQKHVTHNEALALLDALVQLAVADRDLAAPPASPAEGDRYIVAADPSGAWAGWAGRIARYQDGAWLSLVPRPGWLAFVADEAELYSFLGGAWVPFRSTFTTLQNLTRLGVGTAADSQNPFAAKLNKALWTALTTPEGGTGDLRYTLNKQAVGNTLSLLMQTGFSGRAEIGLTEDDNLRVKVSADGAHWVEALRIDRASGNVEVAGLGNSHRNRLRNAGFRINQRAVSSTVTLTAGQYGHDGFKAGTAGCTYTFARSGGITTLTITAGTLLQIIEGAIYLPEGGTYTLSWVGTAQGRIGSGSYAASPVTVTNAVPDGNITVEWGTGTLALPMFEPGTKRTVFEHRDDELRRNQRYFQSAYAPGVAPGTPNAAVAFNGSSNGSSYAIINVVTFAASFRAIPTVTLYSIKTGASGKVYKGASDTDLNAYTQTLSREFLAVALNNAANSSGDFISVVYTASAEL